MKGKMPLGKTKKFKLNKIGIGREKVGYREGEDDHYYYLIFDHMPVWKLVTLIQSFFVAVVVVFFVTFVGGHCDNDGGLGG